VVHVRRHHRHLAHLPGAVSRHAVEQHTKKSAPGDGGRAFLRLTALRIFNLSDDLYEHKMSSSSSSHRFTHCPSFAWR
jgi:hypothetical protein